jgi:hypothetical protein
MRIACAGAALAAAAVLMVASTAGAAAPAAPAPAVAGNPLAATSSAQLAGDLRPLAARKVKIKTTDRRPGGLMDADVSWSGRGPFRTKVLGTIQDVEPDGHCVLAYVWGDGASRLVGEPACPSGSVKGFRYTFKHRVWRALVRVCLTSPREGMRYCSPWS